MFHRRTNPRFGAGGGRVNVRGKKRDPREKGIICGTAFEEENLVGCGDAELGGENTAGGSACGE